MKTAVFAGEPMMAITDDAGGFDLHYLGHMASGFATMEEAIAAGPAFVRKVLERMLSLISG